MKELLLIGEDALCCALGEKLISEILPGWQIAGDPINKRGITKLLSEIPRYASYARHHGPVLCIADTDHRCPLDLLEQALPADVPEGMMLRFAVSEAESWVLADRGEIARFLGIPKGQITSTPEQLPDAKIEMLRLAKNSTVRLLREEMVSAADKTKKGSGYNAHICRFVREKWSGRRAEESAISLRRAIARLQMLMDKAE